MNIERGRETHNEKGALSLLVHISFCLMLGLSDNFQAFFFFLKKLLAQFPPLNCNYMFSVSVSELRSRHIGPYLLDLWALGSTEMKMADSEKAQEIVDAECLDEAPLATSSTPGEQDDHTKTEMTTTTSSPQREKEADIEGEQSLLSMPCLMKELRGDSAESQHASVGSEKPASRHAYESDSSNPCMLSPSSSGHLADSDTLSSGDERAAPRAGEEEEEEGRMEAENDAGQTTEKQASSAAAGGRKSRRSHSESEMPPNAMAAKKNRCQPAVVAAGAHEKQTNGKLLKVKGHRSQKHKERMRLLRQKREAAARKKYNLLQDSSTSDSELTCDSSTSSSEDEDDDTSGGSKTIKTDISGNGQCTLHMLVTR